jgi:hypothetical protein
MTVSHIHGPAAATEVAEPVIETMTETLARSAPITDVQAAALKAGMHYVNMHPADFPDGEIRSQLEVKK